MCYHTVTLTLTLMLRVCHRITELRVGKTYTPYVPHPIAFTKSKPISMVSYTEITIMSFASERSRRRRNGRNAKRRMRRKWSGC